MNLIDIHAHLQFPQFDEDREVVIGRARVMGIGVINVGTDLEISRRAIELAEKYSDMMRAIVGIHPTDPPETDKFDKTFIELGELAKHSLVVGIGECGLDYFHVKDSEERKKQKEIFERQIVLAQKVNKPLMIHCRNAYEDLLEILAKKLQANEAKSLLGNIHFFASDWSMAQKFLDLGCYLSFTGVITFIRDYDEVIKNIPLDRIMIETDCPFVAPVPYRGRRNEPSYLPLVAERVAAIRGLSIDEIIQATSSNAQHLFAFSPDFC
ncbi:MAG TPA: TatD family hydrolase [Candidatus Paceibacterota bacterium]